MSETFEDLMKEAASAALTHTRALSRQEYEELRSRGIAFDIVEESVVSLDEKREVRQIIFRDRGTYFRTFAARVKELEDWIDDDLIDIEYFFAEEVKQVPVTELRWERVAEVKLSPATDTKYVDA